MCYDAVADGDADCVLVSNYRIPSEEETLRKKNLYTVPTGESILCGRRKNDRILGYESEGIMLGSFGRETVMVFRPFLW